MFNIIDENGNKVGIFDGGVAYMDDGTYGECTHAWLDENGYELVEVTKQ